MEFNEFKDRVSFLKYTNSGPYPDDKEEVELYSCFCEVYSPSIKDIEILKSTQSLIGITIVIRDPGMDYQPLNNHIVKVDKRIYANKLFNIQEVRVNTPPNYITLVLSEK